VDPRETSALLLPRLLGKDDLELRYHRSCTDGRTLLPARHRRWEGTVDDHASQVEASRFEHRRHL